MAHGIKLAAAFESDEALKNTLQELNEAGFNKDELSVLLAKTDDDAETQVAAPEVRPYPEGFHGMAAAPAWQSLGLGFYPYEAGLAYAPARDEHAEEADIEAQYDVKTKDSDALLKDAAKGGVMGALAGAASSLLPGLGLIAAGPIAAASALLATGAAIGTGAGALLGLFKDEGLPVDKAEAYREALEKGLSVLLVQSHTEWDENTQLAMAHQIIERHHPQLMDQLKTGL